MRVIKVGSLCTGALLCVSMTTAQQPTPTANAPANPSQPTASVLSSPGNPTTQTPPATATSRGGTNNSPGNPAASSSGNPAPSLSAQPSQTGSMESARANSTNVNQALTAPQRQTVGSHLSVDAQQPTGAPLTPADPQWSGATPVVGVDPGLQTATQPTVNGIIPVARGLAVADLQERGLPADDWRIVNQNGRWWFWAPEQSWLYFDNNQWVTYPAPEQQEQQASVAGGSIDLPTGYPPEEWRLMFHRGHWWFWTPSEKWLYFRNGSWNQYPISTRVAARESAEDPHAVGYRGSPDSQGAPRVPTPETLLDGEAQMRAGVETED